MSVTGVISQPRDFGSSKLEAKRAAFRCRDLQAEHMKVTVSKIIEDCNKIENNKENYEHMLKPLQRYI